MIFFEPAPEFNEGALGYPKSGVERLRSMNFGFGNSTFDIESVPGRTIATLPIETFLPLQMWDSETSEAIQRAVADIMGSVADADALIIDLRANHGGDPNTVSS